VRNTRDVSSEIEKYFNMFKNSEGFYVEHVFYLAPKHGCRVKGQNRLRRSLQFSMQKGFLADGAAME
jgi:hypothetical protein